ALAAKQASAGLDSSSSGLRAAKRRKGLSHATRSVVDQRVRAFICRQRWHRRRPAAVSTGRRAAAVAAGKCSADPIRQDGQRRAELTCPQRPAAAERRVRQRCLGRSRRTGEYRYGTGEILAEE